MADAQGAEVGAVGGAAGVPGDRVVDLGESGAAVAAGEPAGAVAGDDEVAQRRGHGVGRAAAVEQVPGEGVGDQAADRGGVVGGDQGADRLRGQGLRPARAEAGDRAGPLGQADQGRQVDHDVDVGAHRDRRPRIGGRVGGRAHGGRVAAAEDQMGQGLDAAFADPGIGRGAGGQREAGISGDAGDDAEAGLRLRESHPGDEQRHAVGLGRDIDIAVAELGLPPPATVRRVEVDERAFGRLAGCRHATACRDRERGCLQRPARTDEGDDGTIVAAGIVGAADPVGVAGQSLSRGRDGVGMAGRDGAVAKGSACGVERSGQQSSRADAVVRPRLGPAGGSSHLRPTGVLDRDEPGVVDVVLVPLHESARAGDQGVGLQG